MSLTLSTCLRWPRWLLPLLFSVPAASASPPLGTALREGRLQLDLRLRYETVHQDNALEDAEALSLRTRLGYTTQPWNRLQAFVELENVDALVDDYSGTPPPQRFSVIPDPEGTELNQWGLRYSGGPGWEARIGRGRLNFDNARWIGSVGWRQNEQTFDGVFLKATPRADLSLNAAYLRRVRSIFFTSVSLEGVLLNAQWVVSPALSLTAYGYGLDYEQPTAATPDADTAGLRVNGHYPLGAGWALQVTAEAAQQSATTASGDFDALYALGELGLSHQGCSLTMSYESLGSDDGRYAVMTPLATLHAHNGWNDVFLVTPATGLRDLHVRLGGSFGKTAWLMKVHDFRADVGGARYGRELNLQLTRPLGDGLSGGLKYGAYRADALAVDTDKAWAWLQYQF